MSIITNKEQKVNNFYLHFRINGEGCEFFDEGLPSPNYIFHGTSLKGKTVYWSWLIDGYFATEKGHQFLNDVVARFLITFKELQIERLPYKPKTKTKAILSHAYKLKELSIHLDSIKEKKLIPERASNFSDFTFWAIKLYAEDLIKQDNFIVYERLENWAFQQFPNHKKGNSTVRAKCRSVWNYYNDRDFKLNEYIKKDKGEVLANRIEHIENVNENRKKDTIAKIKSAIVYLKEKEKKITAKAIAEFSGLHQNTLTKYKQLWKNV